MSALEQPTPAEAEAPRKRRPYRTPEVPYQWAVRKVLWDGQPHTFGEILAEAGPYIEAGKASRKFLSGSRGIRVGESLSVEQEAKLSVPKAVAAGRQRHVYEYLRGLVRYGGVLMVLGPRTRAQGIMADTYQWPEAPGLYGEPVPRMPAAYNLGEDEPEAEPEPPAPADPPEFSEDKVLRLEADIERSMKSYVVIGACLRLIHDEKLFAYGDFLSFEDYTTKRWDMTPQHARAIMRASDVAGVLKEYESSTPSRLVHALALAPLLHRPDALLLAWEKAQDTAPGRVTKAHIDGVVASILNPAPPEPQTPPSHIPVPGGEPYTPPEEFRPAPPPPPAPAPPPPPPPPPTPPVKAVLTAPDPEVIRVEILDDPIPVLAKLLVRMADALLAQNKAEDLDDRVKLVRLSSFHDTCEVVAREVLDLPV